MMSFVEQGYIDGKTCIALAEVPTVEAKEIVVGQWAKGQGMTWRASLTR